MNSRTKARRKALDILFEADLKGEPADKVLEDRLKAPEVTIAPYVREIVRGTAAHLDDIDEHLRTYSQGWTLERMPTVDRAILRLAVWELLYNDAVPDAVAIAEAVEIAKDLSTDDSPTFINGLLGQILRVKPTLIL